MTVVTIQLTLHTDSDVRAAAQARRLCRELEHRHPKELAEARVIRVEYP